MVDQTWSAVQQLAGPGEVSPGAGPAPLSAGRQVCRQLHCGAVELLQQADHVDQLDEGGGRQEQAGEAEEGGVRHPSLPAD